MLTLKINKDSIVPLYFQLAEALREQIRSGILQPGDALPSESELIQNFTISRGTVRQAFQLLSQEHLIERFPGRGSFVAGPKLSHDVGKAIGFFSRIAAEAGLRPDAKVLEKQYGGCSPFVASQLQVGNQTDVLHLRRLRLINGEPWALEVSFFSGEIGASLRKEDLAKSVYALIQDKLGMAIRESNNSIEADTASEDIAVLLGVAEGAPLLRVSRQVFGEAPTPFEYSVDYYRADRIQLALNVKFDQANIDLSLNPLQEEQDGQSF
jgi:GntR family transcriptional regulator